MSETKNLDYQGLKCPMPIFKLGKEIKELEEGNILHITSDDMAFKPDLEAFCSLRKMNILSMDEENGIITATITKK